RELLAHQKRHGGAAFGTQLVVHGLGPLVRTSPHISAHFVNGCVGRAGRMRTFAGYSRSGGRAVNALALPAHSHFQRPFSATVSAIGGQEVLSDRATTGFGGLIVITTILLAVQLVTGTGAFPL